MLEFIIFIMASWGFFGLLRQKFKREKGNHFAKKIIWCLVPLCKNDGPKFKTF